MDALQWSQCTISDFCRQPHRNTETVLSPPSLCFFPHGLRALNAAPAGPRKLVFSYPARFRSHRGTPSPFGVLLARVPVDLAT
jgi:hypothetical protein